MLLWYLIHNFIFICYESFQERTENLPINCHLFENELILWHKIDRTHVKTKLWWIKKKWNGLGTSQYELLKVMGLLKNVTDNSNSDITNLKHTHFI